MQLTKWNKEVGMNREYMKLKGVSSSFQERHLQHEHEWKATWMDNEGDIVIMMTLKHQRQGRRIWKKKKNDKLWPRYPFSASDDRRSRSPTTTDDPNTNTDIEIINMIINCALWNQLCKTFSFHGNSDPFTIVVITVMALQEIEWTNSSTTTTDIMFGQVECTEWTSPGLSLSLSLSLNLIRTQSLGRRCKLLWPTSSSTCSLHQVSLYSLNKQDGRLSMGEEATKVKTLHSWTQTVVLYLFCSQIPFLCLEGLSDESPIKTSGNCKCFTWVIVYEINTPVVSCTCLLSPSSSNSLLFKVRPRPPSTPTANFWRA